jgi:hypothetical protein
MVFFLDVPVSHGTDTSIMNSVLFRTVYLSGIFRMFLSSCYEWKKQEHPEKKPSKCLKQMTNSITPCDDSERSCICVLGGIFLRCSGSWHVV